MAQVNFLKGLNIIAVDQPFYRPDAVIDLAPGEQVLAALTVETDGKEIDAVLLIGEICWRITPKNPDDTKGRMKIRVLRNGIEIYKKEDDAFIPPGFSCARLTSGVLGLDINPGIGSLKYELVVSSTVSENVDLFRVVGPLVFCAGAAR